MASVRDAASDGSERSEDGEEFFSDEQSSADLSAEEEDESEGAEEEEEGDQQELVEAESEQADGAQARENGDEEEEAHKGSDFSLLAAPPKPKGEEEEEEEEPEANGSTHTKGAGQHTQQGEEGGGEGEGEGEGEGKENGKDEKAEEPGDVAKRGEKRVNRRPRKKLEPWDIPTGVFVLHDDRRRGGSRGGGGRDAHRIRSSRRDSRAEEDEASSKPEESDVLPEGESRESIKGERPSGRRKQRLWGESDKTEMKWGHDMFEKLQLDEEDSLGADHSGAPLGVEPMHLTSGVRGRGRGGGRGRGRGRSRAPSRAQGAPPRDAVQSEVAAGPPANNGPESKGHLPARARGTARRGARGRGQDSGGRAHSEPHHHYAPDGIKSPNPTNSSSNGHTPSQGRNTPLPQKQQRFEVERQGNKVTITRGGRAPNQAMSRGRKGYTGYTPGFVPSSTSSTSAANKSLGPATPETADLTVSNPAPPSPAPAASLSANPVDGASSPTPVVTFGTMTSPIQQQQQQQPSVAPPPQPVVLPNYYQNQMAHAQLLPGAQPFYPIGPGVMPVSTSGMHMGHHHPGVALPVPVGQMVYMPSANMPQQTPEKKVLDIRPPH